MNGVYRYKILALLLCLVIGAGAANTVSLSSVSGAPGTEVTVTVSLANTESVSALQFSISLGEYLSYVDGSLSGSTRLSKHTLSAVEKDGMLNIMVYSLNMDAISGASGELLTFSLLLGNAPEDVALAPTALILTSTDGKQLSGNTENGSVSIRCAKAQYNMMTIDFGSVPIQSTYTETLIISNIGNETLTINNIVFLDATFSTTASFPLEIAAGSSQSLEVKYAPTVRGDVNTQMSVNCNSISKLNTIKLTAQPYAVNELHVGDASGISDEEVTITLTMNNMDDIYSFQANFKLPEELEYVDGSFELSDRKQDHTAGASLHDDELRLIGYSSSSTAFKGNDGEIGHFKVKLVGRYSTTLKPYEAILTGIIDGKVENVISADYGGQITISSPQLNASNKLDFGDVPVTDDIKKTFTISNYGSAPLTISKIVFDQTSFSVAESLPLQIEASKSQTITVVNSDKTEGDFATTMQIYSNDPDLRMYDVDVKGRVFAPNYLTFAVTEASSEMVTLRVYMDNYDEVMGVEFDLTAAEGYSLNSNDIELADRAQGLVVSSRQIDKNTLRVIAYTESDGLIRSEGRLMTLGLVPAKTLADGSYSLAISNILMGVKDLSNKYAGKESLTINFNVPNVTKVPIQISKYGKATYCGDQPLDFSGTDEVKAFIATGYDKNEGIIWITRVKDVPARVPVMIKGTASETYEIPVVDEGTSYYKNMFVGNTSGESISISETSEDGKYVNYYMSGGQFKSVKKSATIGNNKCYLQLPADFEPESTGEGFKVKIAASGKSSFAAPYDLDFTELGDDLRAFTATGYDKSTKTIWLTRVKKVQKGEGLLLKGTASMEYTIPSTGVQASYVNMIVGNISGETLTIYETSDDGTLTNFYLKSGTYMSVSGNATIGNNKSYLQLPTYMLAGARSENATDAADVQTVYDFVELETESMPIIFASIGEGDGETTGIMDNGQWIMDKDSDQWYDMQGLRIEKPTKKGLYIHNGKKVVIRSTTK